MRPQRLVALEACPGMGGALFSILVLVLSCAAPLAWFCGDERGAP